MKGAMGKLWSQNIERITRSDQKELPAFRDVQRCRKDLQRRRFGTPACYEAWKRINAISQVESELRVDPSVRNGCEYLMISILSYVGDCS